MPKRDSKKPKKSLSNNELTCLIKFKTDSYSLRCCYYSIELDKLVAVADGLEVAYKLAL